MGRPLAFPRMSTRTAALFCVDLTVVWRCATLARETRDAEEIRGRLQSFELFTEQAAGIRYLSYATTPVGKKAPELKDQIRSIIDCNIVARALATEGIARSRNFLSAYDEYAWHANPWEIGEFFHLLGHFLDEKPWKQRAKRRKYHDCKYERLPRPSNQKAEELLTIIGQHGAPPDNSDAVPFYLQYRRAMDELAHR
jgi:hypothetical protein